MRYCRACHAPVQDPQAPACAACGAFLETTDKPSPEELDRPVVLAYCSSLQEAALLQAALAAQDIDTLIEDVAGFGLSGFEFGAPLLGTRVLVRPEDVEAALDFLRRKEAGEFAITDEDIPTEQEPDQTGGEKA